MIKMRFTVFQKLFLSYVAIGIFALVFIAWAYYDALISTIEQDVNGQVYAAFQKAIAYFEEFYNKEIRNDLELVTLNPLLDNFLMSRSSEVYLSQPNMEKLVLHFTKSLGSKYLSMRFIDQGGQERIVGEGNHRIYQYFNEKDHPHDELYGRMFKLYRRLQVTKVRVILFEGPFLDHEKMTFLVGMAKQDPETGVFAGAIIAHCDLSRFFHYLSLIKLRGMSLISVTSPDARDVFFPRMPVATNSIPLFDIPSNEDFGLSVEKQIYLGNGGDPIFKVSMHVPRSIFANDIQASLNLFFLFGFAILSLVGAFAYLISHTITRPIKALLDSTRKIALGDWSIRVPVHSQDEIGQLSQSFNEMLESLKKSEERLQYEAFHDILTSLPNRSLLLDRLERMIERHRRHSDHKFAVLFVDLDRFKMVNDSLGHTRGDELLVAISHRLRNCLRTMDTVARLGGDEFIILMDEINDVRDATKLADRILHDLSPVFMIAGQEIYISASIGIAVSNASYTQPSEYLRDTDTAMYRAKALGKARYQVFDSKMRTHVIASLQMESELRNAIERDELLLYYQPIVSLTSRQIVRQEALIRWQHPRLGLMLPADFIPLAEETGLIWDLGRWVIEEVCRQIKSWQDQDQRVVPISVNVSAKQFEQKEFLPTLKEILLRSGLNGNMLTIEITESTAMRDVSLSIAVLNELRNLGIKIAIDDFGIGYSSLSSLKLFAIDELKIDYSFIHDIIEKPDKAAIAKAILVMAKSLGYTVTAEGIETQAQLEFLIAHGCDDGQGHLFAPALPVSSNGAKLSKG